MRHRSEIMQNLLLLSQFGLSRGAASFMPFFLSLSGRTLAGRRVGVYSGLFLWARRLLHDGMETVPAGM